jgi:hypothetical protein
LQFLQPERACFYILRRRMTGIQGGCPSSPEKYFYQFSKRSPELVNYWQKIYYELQ